MVHWRSISRDVIRVCFAWHCESQKKSVCAPQFQRGKNEKGSPVKSKWRIDLAIAIHQMCRRMKGVYRIRREDQQLDQRCLATPLTPPSRRTPLSHPARPAHLMPPMRPTRDARMAASWRRDDGRAARSSACGDMMVGEIGGRRQPRGLDLS
jgi:hypothetical protein